MKDMNRITLWLIAALAVIGIALAFLGCEGASPFQYVIQREALVMGAQGFGSGVSLGDGLYVSARHVVNEDSMSLISRFGIDRQFSVIDSSGEVYLLHSFSLRGEDSIEYADPAIGMQVFFCQPTWDGSIDLLYETGRISRIEDSVFYVDRPVLPGISGAGAYDSDGNLVGMFVQMQTFETPYFRQIIGGKCILSSRIRKIAEWRRR